MRETRLDHLQGNHPLGGSNSHNSLGAGGRAAPDENVFKTRKSAMVMDQLLDELVAGEVKLKKLYFAQKEEFGTVSNKVRS